MNDRLPPETVPSWRIACLRGLVRVLFRLLTRVQVSGLERIPATGGAVLIFNHLSNVDPPLFFALIRRPKLTALIAADYRDRPVHRFFIEAAGGLWIRRGASDRAALKSALELLERGWLIGLAPEGRRSRNHALAEAKRGAAFLAVHAGVPVLPVGVTGTEHIVSSLKHLRRSTVTVRFGEPFRLPSLEQEDQKQQLQAFTEAMMCHVAALVPPSYRGVYAGHPRLQVVLQRSSVTTHDRPDAIDSGEKHDATAR